MQKGSQGEVTGGNPEIQKIQKSIQYLDKTEQKIYFGSNLTLHRKNPKKTWDLLKEAANLSKSNDGVEKIISENVPITDPGQIAEKFNDYFVKIGTSISKTEAKPEDFMPNLPDLQNLEFEHINPTHICDIIKSLQAKNSMDSDGISSNLL